MNLGFRLAIGALLLSLFPVAMSGTDKGKDVAGQVVDSGTFGVFRNGQRIATETFSVEQNSAGSVATAQFKTETGVDPAVQTSEMQLTTAGELRRYEFKELSPGKAQAVVMPNDNFLIERSTANPQEKQQEQPFLLPASTTVLDDYFFIHREILAWRYLQTGCRHENGQTQCPLNQKTQFGTLNPHQRSSMLVSMEFAGKDKVAIRGVQRELSRFLLKSDGGEWALWLDDQYKLVRVQVAGESTEVVRD